MSLPLILVVLAASPNPQTWSFKTGPKADVSVANIAGSISVESTSGDQVTVEAKIVDGEGSP